jgi:hypothetical protein
MIGLLSALHTHHERMAHLLDGLDDLQTAVEDGDGIPLLGTLTECLRAREGQLEHLVGRLHDPPQSASKGATAC